MLSSLRNRLVSRIQLAPARDAVCTQMGRAALIAIVVIFETHDSDRRTQWRAIAAAARNRRSGSPPCRPHEGKAPVLIEERERVMGLTEGRMPKDPSLSAICDYG